MKKINISAENLIIYGSALAGVITATALTVAIIVTASKLNFK